MKLRCYRIFSSRLVGILAADLRILKSRLSTPPLTASNGNCRRRSPFALKTCAGLSVASSIAILPLQTVHADGPVYAFSELTAPSTPYNQGANAIGINDEGVILWFATDAAGGGVTSDSNNFIYVSGAQQTTVTGINNAGEVVGSYVLPYIGYGNTIGHGFTDIGGVYTDVYDPRTGPNNYFTINGVNNLGAMVGTEGYFGQAGYGGFVDNGGTFTNINVPNAETTPLAINDSGVVVGYYTTSDDHEYGFLDAGGLITTINEPTIMISSYVTGINDAGEICGWYNDTTGHSDGFVYSGGTFTTVDDPNNGVGGSSLVFGINDEGQIDGYSIDASRDNFVSFLATPLTSGMASAPEPSAFGFLVSGLFATAVWARRKKA